ncbi:MAG: tRNA-dihydrouridine synthase [Arenicella sp.]|nr:tRNA-dihydrouridine synthase [Arenicella sp.]
MSKYLSANVTIAVLDTQQTNSMRILLAPMEGVVDAQMRAVLTQIGGYHRCVTEFVRVTEQVIPNHVFRRFSPELENGGTTPSGTPVYVQLLGGNAKFMAINAARVAKLEPPGIDINFGCPSKTVNNSDGGSVLLREPQRVGEIIRAVRDAVDPSIPVTVKIRLGFSNSDLLDEVVQNVIDGGANELAIHARTKEDRYKPPAYWSVVKSVSDKISLPVIINGEIWSADDAINALEQSGCQDLMLGRGAMAFPDLAADIQSRVASGVYQVMPWQEVLTLVLDYLRRSENKHPMFVSNRAKQWLVFLRMHYPEATPIFHAIKRFKLASDVFAVLEASL